MKTKKAILLIFILLLVVISCDKPEPIPGIVGKRIHLAPLIESRDDTLACTYGWSFVEKPAGSNMDILSFQPNSRSFNISFVPDAAGDYVVAYSIVGPDGKVKDEKELLCRVIEDTSSAPAPKEEGYALSEEAMQAPAPVYEDTKEKRTPAQPTYPDSRETTPAPKPRPQKPIGQSIPSIPGKYTIQISSWKTYAGAERAVRLLDHLNLDLYIQKATFLETGETWYRVRTGNFDNRNAAKAALKELKAKLPHELLWIDLVRQD
ncbi:MAG TPA: SPOR domain-containing protein [Candidatus Marinimicrobia bacterium]|nr:SPOR domain-containing protein [Candidatus Neomarinimicrobiota bacterium]